MNYRKVQHGIFFLALMCLLGTRPLSAQEEPPQPPQPQDPNPRNPTNPGLTRSQSQPVSPNRTSISEIYSATLTICNPTIRRSPECSMPV